jgi:hypothetical protein
MPSANDDSTACSSPVFSAKHLPTTTPSSSSSTLLPRPAPQPPRRGSFFSFFRSPPTRPSPPVQSQAQQSALQTVNISFPAYLVGAPAPITISEPGLLGKKVSRFYELVDPKLGYSVSNSFLSFGNSPLENEQIFSDYGIISGSTILLNPVANPTHFRRPSKRAPRKPVIYLYPPSSLADVTVELALTSSWRFSAVHPPPQATVPPGEPHTAQSLTWTVSAEPDGTLIDKSSGMEVSYLYWEAM